MKPRGLPPDLSKFRAMRLDGSVPERIRRRITNRIIDSTQDIVESVDDIESFVSNMDFGAFCRKATLPKVSVPEGGCINISYV